MTFVDMFANGYTDVPAGWIPAQRARESTGDARLNEGIRERDRAFGSHDDPISTHPSNRSISPTNARTIARRSASAARGGHV